VDPETSAQDLRSLLQSISPRADLEAALGRARVCDRLRELGEPDAAELLARGDAANVQLLSQPAPPEVKAEAAGRLSRHFRERAEAPALRRSSIQGPWGEPLHRFLLLLVASWFGEYLPVPESAETLDRLAQAARGLAEIEALRPQGRRHWEEFSSRAARRGEEARGREGPPEPSAAARKFCECSLDRHLEEATRAADAATREKVARGDEDRIIEGYLTAIAHFVAVQECLADPGPTQRDALAALEVVLRSFSDMLSREP
jgi:hypothetical protein